MPRRSPACLAAVISAVLTLGTGTSVRASAATISRCAGFDPEALLVRARQAFRARPQPPYVVYTITRRETVAGVPDFDMTYRNRVWFRTADGAALTRRMKGAGAGGALVFERPRFNAPLDPGPPTADIFQPAPVLPRVSKEDDPASPLREIGRVSAHVETDYHASILSCDASTVHLALHPRRDPDRNRLRDLWIDRATFAVRRFVATDRLYLADTDIWNPDIADATLQLSGNTPLVTVIHMVADTDGGPEVSDYRFEDISFPSVLPNWYFEPQTYGEHRADAPTQ